MRAFVVASTLLLTAAALADPPRYDVTVERATTALERGDFAGAVKLASSAVAQDSSRYEAYYYAGLAEYKLDHLDDAEQDTGNGRAQDCGRYAGPAACE